MKVVGFNFLKVSAEKMHGSFENLKIDTKIDILDIKEIQTDMFKSKEELVSFEFGFNMNYNPDVAKIELKGIIVFSLEPKLAKDILKQWKENKLPSDFRMSVLNIILRKCNIKALFLEEEMNIPFHFRLPSLSAPDEEKSKK